MQENSVFCIIPWIHLKIEGDGAIKQCCFSHTHVTEKTGVMSLYEFKFQDIWNSAYMQRLRSDLRGGVMRPECITCYENEANMGRSGRTNANSVWIPSLSELGMDASRLEELPLRVESHPIYYHIDTGYSCNLACRMCSSDYSSRIAGDPVHSKWSPLTKNSSTLRKCMGHAADGRVTISLLPTRPRGITYLGITECLVNEERLSVIDAKGTIIINNKQHHDQIDGIIVELSADREEELGISIAINGKQSICGIPDPGDWDVEIDINDKSSEAITIDIETIGVGSLPIKDISMVLKSSDPNNMPNSMSRYFTDSDWVDQPITMYKELFDNPSCVRELYFAGGEPFTLKQIPNILSFLIDAGVSSNMTISFSTNSTICNSNLVSILSQFKKVNLYLSIDGIGPLNEYIRFNSKWDIILENIKQLRQIHNASIIITPAIQIYNIHRVVEIFKFFDSMSIEVYSGLLYQPEFLSIDMLPPNAAARIAANIDSYILGGGSKTSNNVQIANLSSKLKSQASTLNGETFQILKLFTNDLDESRNQSIIITCPELTDDFKEIGFVWND